MRRRLKEGKRVGDRQTGRQADRQTGRKGDEPTNITYREGGFF